MRRRFPLLLILSLPLASCPAPAAAAEGPGPGLSHGPFLGHAGPDEVRIWARAKAPGVLTLILREASGGSIRRVTERADPARDLCVTWTVAGLKPDTDYLFHVVSGDGPPPGPGARARTAPAAGSTGRVTLGFGSCAFDAVNPRYDEPVWTRIKDERVDAMVLLGDTPYIESSDLAVQRRRYREFFALPQLAAAFREVPFYGVWDDHDFGPNDALGTTPGKEGSRQAFLEYHANPSYGLDDQGVFTRFRRGPVEVFLIDTRWFSNTERSPVNPDRMTLLGRRQWDWLTRSLRESTASVKVLASSMIWNEAVYPGKVDCWVAYPYERHALFKFLGDHKIKGVVLVGGDIHLSRALVHPTREFAGYDLPELVTSPLAEGVALYCDIPSPYLKFNAPLEDTFLKLTVDGASGRTTVIAEFLTAKEPKPHYRMVLDVDRELAPAR